MANKNTGLSSQSTHAKAAAVRYFSEYGGWAGLVGSPFFWAAIVITLALFPMWKTEWAAGAVLSAVPAMLGFSIAAFTFSLGIGTDEFKLLMGRRIKGTSITGVLSVSFVHFVVVQVLALISSFALSAHWAKFILQALGVAWGDLPEYLKAAVSAVRLLAGGTVTLLFIYAILCGLPAIFCIYEASRAFQNFADHKAAREKK